MESLSLKVFWNCGVVTLTDMVSGRVLGGLELDLMLEVFSSLQDSMINDSVL